MIGFEVKTADVIAGLARFAKDIESGAEHLLDGGLQSAATFAASEPQPFKTHTGRLKRSIGWQATRGRELQGRLFAKAPYAKWVEYGRGPVRPVRAKFLRFRIGGKLIFAKFCKPAAARPFIRPAAARAEILMLNGAEALVNVAAGKV